MLHSEAPSRLHRSVHIHSTYNRSDFHGFLPVCHVGNSGGKCLCPAGSFFRTILLFCRKTLYDSSNTLLFVCEMLQSPVPVPDQTGPPFQWICGFYQFRFLFEPHHFRNWILLPLERLILHSEQRLRHPPAECFP